VYGHIPASNNFKFNVFTAIKRLELDGIAVDELSTELRNPSLSAKKRKSLEKELERRLQGYSNNYSIVSSYGFTIEDGYNVVKDDRYYTALAKVYYQGIAQHINDFQNNEYFAPFESTLQITQAAQAIYMGAKLSQLMSKATNTYNNEAVSARNSKATYSNSYQYAEYTKPTFIDRLKEAANGVKNDAKVLGKRVVTETRGSARILPPKKTGAGVGNGNLPAVVDRRAEALQKQLKAAAGEGSGPVIELGEAGPSFASPKLLRDHFTKHGKEFRGMYKDSFEYLEGARELMRTGTKVEYLYKGETRIGYVRYAGNSSKGVAKFDFVGTNNAGNITTYHIESGKDFWKMLNKGNNIQNITPIK